MFGIGGGEITVIVLVALLLLGPDRLPGIARSIARAYRELVRVRKQVDVSVKELRDDLKIDVDLDLDDDLNLNAAPKIRAPQGERVTRDGSPASEPARPVLEVPEEDDYLSGDFGAPVKNAPLLSTAPEDDYLAEASPGGPNA